MSAGELKELFVQSLVLRGLYIWKVIRIPSDKVSMKRFLRAGSILLALGLARMIEVSAAEQTTAVTLSLVPPAAQKTILAQVGKGRLGDINQLTEDGKTSYEVEFTRDEVHRSLSVEAGGKLLSWQVLMSELPDAVQKTIQEQVGKGKLEEIDKTFDDDGFTYDVTVKRRNGREYSFTVSAAGKLIGVEMELGQTPKEVQKTIKEQVGDGRISSIEKSMEDQEVTYDVEAEKSGKELSFRVAPDGKLITEED
jgi:uncharacterized membrane protein YkoI